MHLTPQERAGVLDILRRHLPGRTVWAFGSRVHGRRLKPFSDLDLAVIGETPLSLAAGLAVRLECSSFGDGCPCISPGPMMSR